MRIAILFTMAGLAACSREPAETADVSVIAAQRAEANIDNYTAVTAHGASRKARRAK